MAKKKGAKTSQSYKGKKQKTERTSIALALIRYAVPSIIAAVMTWSITAYKFGYWEGQYENTKRREATSQLFFLLSNLRQKEFALYFATLSKKNVDSPSLPMDLKVRLMENGNKLVADLADTHNKINSLGSDIHMHFSLDERKRIVPLINGYTKIWQDVNARIMSWNNCSEQYLNEEDAKSDKIWGILQKEFDGIIFKH